MPEYVKQWFLGTVLVALISGGYALYREVSTNIVLEWNAKRLLLVEMRYRVGQIALPVEWQNASGKPEEVQGAIAKSSPNQEIRLGQQALCCSNSSRKALSNNKIHEILNNKAGKGSGYIIPSLRDRSFLSLYWDIVQRFPFGDPIRDKLDDSMAAVRSMLAAGGQGDQIAVCKKSRQSHDILDRLWQDHVDKDRPSNFWFPNRAKMFAQGGGL